jgi:hypothetical protein
MPKKKPKRTDESRSGTVWTEDHYKAFGYRTIKLRLLKDTLDALDALSAERGEPRWKVVSALIMKAAKRG